MEYAIWNNKQISATDVSNSYELEKEVRKASKNKELHCPDSSCSQTILCFRHGEIRNAHFAHVNNASCDYAYFDKKDTKNLHTIRHILYKHFKSLGYDVQMEVKILDHHYTHLLFNWNDGSRVAVELCEQNTTANELDLLTKEYQKKGVAVKWIVVGKTNFPIQQNKMYFSKRYQLNESVNKDLIVIEWDGSVVAQYKADEHRYRQCMGTFLPLESKDPYYIKIDKVDSLCFEGKELSLTGFQLGFKEWSSKRQIGEDILSEKDVQKIKEGVRNGTMMKCDWCGTYGDAGTFVSYGEYNKCQKCRRKNR